MRRALFILVALCLVPVGCFRATADRPVLEVTASYPGANARVVADTVAAPIEEDVNGVEGMVWMQSESRNDGSYVLRVRFNSKADPKVSQVLVQNRVALAMSRLPDQVKQGDIAVKLGAGAVGETGPVVIALEDRGDNGLQALRAWSDDVVKRLEADGALVKPEVFPGPDEKQIDVRVNRETCARHGVKVDDVMKAVRAVGPAAKIDDLKQQTVTSAQGDEVPLGALASFAEVPRPPAVYRVNLYPAMRITGSPPEGQTAAEAARRCVKLAEAERDKNHSVSFAVEYLTVK
jgi:multidrug efflux pump subunit AcrB